MPVYDTNTGNTGDGGTPDAYTKAEVDALVDAAKESAKQLRTITITTDYTLTSAIYYAGTSPPSVVCDNGSAITITVEGGSWPAGKTQIVPVRRKALGSVTVVGANGMVISKPSDRQAQISAGYSATIQIESDTEADLQGGLIAV